MSGDDVIFHIVPLSELRACTSAGHYIPARFADDGFVHCTATPRAVLAVARDYFGDVAEPLILLRIDPARLQARVAYEAPAPVQGAGTSHLAEANEFPHVYGPLELAAITGAAVLPRHGDELSWPESFTALDDLM